LSRAARHAKPRLLVAYSNAATHVSTTVEYLSSFKKHSVCEVSYLHVTDGAQIDLDLNEFDAVFNSYCARLCFPGYVSQSYLDALKAFRGVRLIAVQDEYDRTDTLRRAIQDIGFHVVFTCVPQQSHEFVYRKEMYPGTEFVTVLTGYVSEALKARRQGWMPLVQRPIAIGYRGRQIRCHYGRLGFDKYEIGRRMREICCARGIRHDIETTEEKRIYGDAWYDFLGQCRSTLGTESGSNVFDFDGSLEVTYRQMMVEYGRELNYDEFRCYTDPRENEVQMGQISPRIFDAAATGTPMILFSGRYSGMISPDEHYIELKKDFSNVNEVLDRIQDTDALKSLGDRAYRHLIGFGKYDYSRFVETVDEVVERKLKELRGVRTSQRVGEDPRRDFTKDPDALSSLKEQPTPAPRDVIYYRYKYLYIEHEVLKREFTSETARLIDELGYLRSEFASETERLANEIKRLESAPIWRFILRRIRARLLNANQTLPPSVLLPLRLLIGGFRRCYRGARSL
jgi:hypothetical protein